MFGISAEHLLILGVVLLFFGPRRLPELGNTLGKAIRNFKDAIQGVEEASFRRVEPPKTTATGPVAGPAGGVDAAVKPNEATPAAPTAEPIKPHSDLS